MKNQNRFGAELRIRIRISFVSWIQIWIRIRVKRWIRIRNSEAQLLNISIHSFTTVAETRSIFHHLYFAQ
jgi:hypothetical protein